MACPDYPHPPYKTDGRRKNFGHILSFTLNPGRRRNVEGFRAGGVFHPIRSSGDYDPRAVGEGKRKRRKVTMRTRRRRVSAHRRRRVVRHNPRRRRSNLFGFRRRRARRSNPGVRRARRHVRHYARRRNPGVGGLVTKAAYTIAGAIGTRLIPNLLPSYNTGVMGYALNAGSAFAFSLVGGKIFGKEAGSYIALGGAVAIVLRILQDFTPLGQYAALSGMGDIGIFQPTTFFVPLGVADQKNANVMTMPAQMQALAAASKGKGKGVSGMGGSRYGSGASRYA